MTRKAQPTRQITPELLDRFARHLTEEERSRSTREYYLRAVRRLMDYQSAGADGGDLPVTLSADSRRTRAKTSELTKETVVRYKAHLLEQGYKPQSVNTMLAALNSFFAFCGWNDLHIKSCRCQRQLFCREDKELTREDYLRLVETAERQGNHRLAIILECLAATGIRISELPFITREAVLQGYALVSLKGKTRVVILSGSLQRVLERYAKDCFITEGPLFVSRSGRPLDRTNIWREMKALCAAAHVDPSKVFPHNFRHLFARVYYDMDKDLVKLADILGHSSVDTTRIYTATTVPVYRSRLEAMALIPTPQNKTSCPSDSLRHY